LVRRYILSNVEMSSSKKPRAIAPGARVRIVSPASPSAPAVLARGLAELTRLGYVPVKSAGIASTKDYFSASAKHRRRELLDALADNSSGAVICTRGGYGSTYLLDKKLKHTKSPRIFLGYSDITALQIYLWQKRGWVAFYGPMVTSGFNGGSGAAHGYDESSLRAALAQTHGGWSLDLGGSTLCKGFARGILLGGCMTLVEATLGTPWELDTRGAILVLEDRAMKPYQVDRVLTHLRQAGKFNGVRGIVLGEFPESVPTVAGSPTVRDVARRILGELEIPVVWGARVGHTPRPMLTIPLGVSARLNAHKSGTLEILEPAVTA
jgi:muramoyltetrapeptide carboxypeptidase